MRDDELLHVDMLRSTTCTWTMQDAKKREESTALRITQDAYKSAMCLDTTIYKAL